MRGLREKDGMDGWVMVAWKCGWWWWREWMGSGGVVL